MYRTHTCGELRLENVGQSVTLRVDSKKPQNGSMSFIDLGDRYGNTQVVIDESSSSELNERYRSGAQYVIR